MNTKNSTPETDIFRGMPLDAAIKTAQAHGFESVQMADIKNIPNRQWLLTVSKARDAFLYAEIKNDKVSYCTISAVAEYAHETVSTSFFGHGACFEGMSDLHLHRCVLFQGCLAQYKRLKQAFPIRQEIPWKKAPVSDMFTIPTPAVFRFSINEDSEKRLIQLLGEFTPEMLVLAEELINKILFVREILPLFPEDVKSMYVRYNKTPYEAVANSLFFTPIRALSVVAAAGIGIALAYLNLPPEEENGYLLAIMDTAALRNQKNVIQETLKNGAVWEEVLEILGRSTTQMHHTDMEADMER